MNPAAQVQEIVHLYERYGRDNYDEDLSQIDHALQTAALARADGASDALVLSALLHDVGHLLALAAGTVEADAGREVAEDLRHEAVGARYLARLLPVSVTAPIALHVRAKRYRCAIDPGAIAALSDGSRRSLERQGGPMDPDEVATFASSPGFADAVLLRSWDDMGKVEGLETPPFDTYLPLFTRVD